ncbi:exodeoxyribonuclease-like [Tubulanus polymorphus]|uniref:exodeoxyribonuclease-like n=1 Tax=Tubulanus polymorphus TaxID=672921 RepID=UPI003DA54C6B
MPKRQKKLADTSEAGDATSPAKKAKAENEAGDKKSSKKVQKKIPDVTELDFSCESKTPEGKPWNLKIASWNVNGIRAWVEKNGQSYITAEDPDVICLQETKCSEEKIPDDCKIDGYHSYWSSAKQEGYAGTGLLSKIKPINVTFGIGIDKHDEEGRVITAEYEKFYLIGSYIPNSGKGLVRLDYRTKEWDKDFFAYLKELDKKKPIIWCGDLNVAHQEIDLKNPKTNKKTAGFTPQERESFGNFLDDGFVDSFRHLYPDKTDIYSFWTYMMNARAKNTGWRLDYFVLSKRLVPNLCDQIIRTDVYGSDHCPLALFMNLDNEAAA